MHRSRYLFAVLTAIVLPIACSETKEEGQPADSDSGTTTPPAPPPPPPSSTPDASGDGSTSTPDGSTSSDAGDGGAQWVGPDGGVTTAMTFFVTSRGMGLGGDLRGDAGDGLLGADAFCKELANAVSPVLGAKTWKAYLGTSTVSARSRIGNGPWVNAKGVVVATSNANLHDEGAMNSLNLQNTLDELGNQVPIAGPNVHDILTGAATDGGLTNSHCSNWTSSAGNVTGTVGHSNRAGGGTNPTSWNSAHITQGCAEQGNNSVRSGGGRGSFYCFAQ